MSCPGGHKDPTIGKDRHVKDQKMIELLSKSLMIHQLRRTGIYYIGFGSPLVPRIEPSVPIL